MKTVEIGKAYNLAIAFVNNKGKALDIGCGCTGRFIDLLQSEDFPGTY